MEELKRLRADINQIDAQLLDLIRQRILVAKKIGHIKKYLNKPVKDSKREQEVLLALLVKGVKLGIDEIGIKRIWSTLFKMSYKVEK